MGEYESKMTFTFEASDWKSATKQNIRLFNLLQLLCNGKSENVVCSGLKEIKDDGGDDV